ncbi:PACE efflux transporter [Rhodoferax sp.]|uniref:PACE efflux transporter n=1 Tax=Rhodoferax sp. TaxID=50421 RepID=UPI0025CFFF80|nr:PACE efflux transporter [Rhodoferax sp.]
MQGIKRKIVYVGLYEGFAIVAATLGLAGMSGHSVQNAGMVAVATSAIAVVWNLVFNMLFERWEARQTVRGRSVARRVAHAIGFEGGLTVFFVPLMAWWFDTTLWRALLLDMGLLVFFLLYTFVFNWVFDRVFGLPAAAMGEAVAA